MNNSETKQPYWIHVTRDVCPVCGNGETWRKRRYSPKPERWEDRNAFDSIYCGCMDNEFISNYYSDVE